MKVENVIIEFGAVTGGKIKKRTIKSVDIRNAENRIEIIDWCVKNNCGWYGGYNSILFSSDDDLTFFLLKWQ